MTNTATLERIRTRTLSKLGQRTLQEMAGHGESDSPVISMFLPMETQGAATRKNPIVFKNALQEAGRSLTEDQREHQPIGRLLDELAELEEPVEPFWQEQLPGLAVFVSETDGVAAYRLPFSVESFVRVGERAHLGPVLPLLDSRPYYVLLLDLNDTQLWEATRWEVRRIDLDDMPTSLDEAMKFDDPEKSLQSHSTSASNAPGAGGGDAVFHGHGVGTGDENRRKKIDRFYEMLAKGLTQQGLDPQQTMVLFGPASELGHLRPRLDGLRVEDEAIEDNPSGFDEGERASRMTSWVTEREERRRRDALERLHDAVGTAEGTCDEEESIVAAFHGRVETFFFAPSVQKFGRFDESRGEVIYHDQPESTDGELLSEAAIRVVQTGGTIHCVDSVDALPGAGSGAAAAVLRY